MSNPPTRTDTATSRETPWPFTVEARVIAVPAPLARLGIGLLAGVIVTIIGATCVIIGQIGQVAAAINLIHR